MLASEIPLVSGVSLTGASHHASISTAESVISCTCGKPGQSFQSLEPQMFLSQIGLKFVLAQVTAFLCSGTEEEGTSHRPEGGCVKLRVDFNCFWQLSVSLQMLRMLKF